MILSLFDYSGAWPEPYLPETRVVCLDMQHPGSHFLPSGAQMLKMNILELAARITPKFFHEPVVGILAAPPCTDFAFSGAQWWREKDRNGSTARSVELIQATLHIITTLQPKWWALENPRGRLEQLVPQLGAPCFGFHPWEFAGFADNPYTDTYSKFTQLWGTFNKQLPRWPLAPTIVRSGGKLGSLHWAGRGGTRLSTKNARSKTPQGFARAFAKANSYA